MANGASVVGLVFPGDSREARVWSGTPRGLASGLEQLGYDVRHVSAELPRPLGVAVVGVLSLLRIGRAETLRRSRAAIREGSAELAELRSAALRRRLARAPGDLRLVQIGTGYTVPPRFPLVTFEDMTVPQAVALNLPEWRAQSATTVRRRIERQRRAYEQAVACCAASSWAARSLTGDHGVAPEKIHVVGLGRNHDPRPLPRDWEAPRMLFVGRDFERKGGPSVLRAFARLRDQVPLATLDVVGGHPRLSLPGVIGHGVLPLSEAAARERLTGLFETCTCCVMPSLFEPFGIVHAEAAAAGAPSIGTTVGGAADVIGPDGGELVPPHDDETLLRAMLRLSRPELASRMGAAALERSRRFTWREVAGRLICALEGSGAKAGRVVARSIDHGDSQ